MIWAMPYKDPAKQKAYLAQHYKDNKGKYLENMNRNRIRQRKYLASYLRDLKEGLPCTDCGQEYHQAVMEFDHVRGEKLGNVGEMVNRAVSLDKLKEEIDKCEPVCANCHRVRTITRQEEYWYANRKD
jgi:hypothetical protein